MTSTKDELEDKLTYAKVDGPPMEWRGLRVFDGDVELDEVIEVDTVKGFAVRYVKDRQGRLVTDDNKPVTYVHKSKDLRIERP